MSRARLIALAGLTGLALLWSARHTAHPADAAGAVRPTRDPTSSTTPIRAALPIRTAKPTSAPLPPSSAPCCARVATLHLAVGDQLDLGRDGTLFATYAPDEAWPLPDELPAALLDEDPVLLILQELLAAESAERDGLLTELDHALDDSDTSSSPWSALARLEAERQLEQALHEDALLDHTRALERWAQRKDRGPLPPPPAPRGNAALADAAVALADDLPAGPAAHVARLTAAALVTDWDGDAFDETLADRLVMDVVLESEDAHLIAAATGILVGLDTAPAPEELDLLADLGGELDATERMRLEWYLTQQRATLGDWEAARTHLERAHGAHTEVNRHRQGDPAVHRLGEALRRARGPLLARTGGTPRHWEEAVLAAAQSCADARPTESQRVRIALTPAGLHALVGSTPLASCLRGALRDEPGPEHGIEITLELTATAP